MTFDDTKTVADLMQTYQLFFIPVAAAHIIYLVGYIIRRIKRG